MVKPIKVIKEKVIVKRAGFSFFAQELLLPTGKRTTWYSIDYGHVVGIVPMDEKGNVYLVREWRPSLKRAQLEIPAGGARNLKKSSETMLQKKAREELMEEVGLDAKKLTKLTEFHLSARMRGRIHIYLAQGLFPAKRKSQDEYEEIEIVRMPISEAIEHFKKNEIPVALTLVGLLLAKEKLDREG